MQQVLAHSRVRVAEGSEWKVETVHRGVFDDLALNIECKDEHAAAPVES
jgi:hypothetical protein